MRWMVVKPVRKHGEIREVRKFAWLPTKVDEGTHEDEAHTQIYKIVWLEHYKAKLKWVVTMNEFGGDVRGRWEVRESRSV